MDRSLATGRSLTATACPSASAPLRWRGDKLLLNGKPIVLRGFGRHEDFPVTGRGGVPAVNIKDYALMNWIGANSFRTSHYPYDEEMLTLADKMGFLVISETPAVGLFFHEDGLERRLELTQQMTQELIEPDKNHPSVIMWSLANEAHSTRGNEVPFFAHCMIWQNRPATAAQSPSSVTCLRQKLPLNSLTPFVLIFIAAGIKNRVIWRLDLPSLNALLTRPSPSLAGPF